MKPADGKLTAESKGVEALVAREGFQVRRSIQERNRLEYEANKKYEYDIKQVYVVKWYYPYHHFILTVDFSAIMERVDRTFPFKANDETTIYITI